MIVVRSGETLKCKWMTKLDPDAVSVQSAIHVYVSFEYCRFLDMSATNIICTNVLG